MPTTILFDRERDALKQLLRLIESRAKAEQSTKAEFDAATQTNQREVQRARKAISASREKELSHYQSGLRETKEKIEEQFATKTREIEEERVSANNQIAEDYNAQEEKARTAYQDALWTAESLYEAGEKEANDARDSLRRIALQTETKSTNARASAEEHLRKRGVDTLDLSQASDLKLPIPEPLKEIERSFEVVEAADEQLDTSAVFKLASKAGFVLIVLFMLVLSLVPVFLLDDKTLAGIVAGVFTIGGSLFGILVLRSAARKQAHKLAGVLAQSFANIAASRVALLELADQQFATQMQELHKHREYDKYKAKHKYEPLLAKQQDRRAAELQGVADRAVRATVKLKSWHAAAVEQTDQHFNNLIQESEAKHTQELKQAEDAFAKKTRSIELEHERQWIDLAHEWRDGTREVRQAFTELLAVSRERFGDWENGIWDNPPKFTTVPGGIYFGKLNVDLHSIPNGVSEDVRLKAPIPSQLYLPAYLPFPARCPLLMKVKDQGKVAAVQALQAIMLRFLTSIPPGKVRFTIIDPVGLGDNFAAFMHLADYDEQLVGARIWTEASQIEKKLADLTAHMENVIQKYLRNQYKSIEEYNEQAGEVAEPYRVLVVANFPTNFSTEAARRLVSIVNSGSTCGLYSLISIDAKAPLPQGFNLADLEQPAINLGWKDGSFQWKDPDMSKFPLSIDQPPDTERLTQLVRVTGERSRDANRVEVPFEFVAPAPDEVWKSDSRKGIVVPIGRSGATKRQMMSLGQGTAQHALIAGKTGSGKSTFLHALITNLALHYSPDEIELYLIDFKKGVEFKAYANLKLPHAKVIAIESEREFGLSVLQRLDAELKARGDRFRDAGVNDVNSFRNAFPDQPCPRILFIVDEFQEFFVEDDKLAQEASLLLDRIVRQGRAFGLHVLLGSQTLGGAYSLARSTIDQMAVRIALQCSDADAQLILNKDNLAARLLSRPGEAIYNDANGLLEGNDLFQIVWLPEVKRERYLESMRDRVNGHFTPPLVFEGNIPSVLSNNQLLMRRLQAPAWGEAPRAGMAWLGEAVAIKDPTAAVFRSQSGNNLLMIGQLEEVALSLFVSSLLSLGSQYPPGSAKLFVLDGTNEDDPNWGTLGKAAAVLPHQVQVVARHELAPTLAGLIEEVNRRQKGETSDRSPRFMLIHGLHRFRDLRKEEDFGFRRGEKQASPGEMFASLMRDGPPVGVHFLMWADTLTNLNRTIDRQGMRECSLRVLFQMSANDSSSLIDTPIASRLGRNRALYVTEESSHTEKFRPYGLPTDEFLAQVKSLFEQRGEAVPA